ncbi:hypothetical protein SLEP1_g11393 [Rubroshorea leprosula]|uniref:Uncharacterized protein n=1 Tax=Rubroshorea leprosula TaxID=152421 RepID=A0AAV5IH18_9ROSI|nr:hypothetical protein SLEP1_g11393 [Rubroshorea leprosula]
MVAVVGAAFLARVREGMLVWGRLTLKSGYVPVSRSGKIRPVSDVN